jgi:hypothetical protein
MNSNFIMTRAPRLIALTLLVSGGIFLNAEEPEMPKDSHLILSQIDSIAPRMEAEFALFREEVQAGTEADGWTEPRKKDALEWIERITTPMPNTPPDASPIQRRMNSVLGMYLSHHGRVPGPSMQPPAQFSEWLEKRVSALLETRVSLLSRYGDELIAYAEDAWLRAKTPADMKPVAAALAELIHRDSRFLLSGDFGTFGTFGPGPPFPNARFDPRFGRPGGPQGIPKQVFEIWILMGSEKPAILPEPEGDPEAFWKARETLLSLLRIDFGFLERPRVASRIGALSHRFVEASNAAREQLEQLILLDAPLAQFAPALERLHSFGGKPFNPYADLPKMPDGQPATALLQQMFIRNGHRVPDEFMALMGREKKETDDLSVALQFGDRWLQLLHAREAAEPREAIADLEAQLLGAPLSEAVKLHIARSFSQAPAPMPENAAKPAALEPDPDPSRALIAGLETIAASDRSADKTENPDAGQMDAAKASHAARSLLDAWRKLSTGDLHGVGADYGEDWQSLAEQPGSLKLLSLRERAARQALAAIMGPKTGSDEPSENPVESIRRALEKTIMAGDLQKAAKIISVDTAAYLLPPEERKPWAQALADFDAAATATDRYPERARSLYLHILITTIEPACAALAAQRLKELVPAEAPR